MTNPGGPPHHGSRNVLPVGNFVDMPDDPPKVSITTDGTRMPNTVDIMIQKEDHTLANLLRMRLNADDKVAFAAYKVAHPVRHEIHLKVQTTEQSSHDSRQAPLDAIVRASDQVLQELDEFQALFDAELSRIGSDIRITD